MHAHTKPPHTHLQGKEHACGKEHGRGLVKGALQIQVVEQLAPRHPLLHVYN